MTQYAPLGITDRLERESPGAHNPIHGTVMAVMGIGLGGTIMAKAKLKGDDQEAEIVANVETKEAAGGQELMKAKSL